MIQDLWKVAKSLVTLADNLEKYHTEIEKIREELRDLTILVHALSQDVRNSKEQNEQRHKNLLLEIENRLLKYDRALPPAAKKATKKRPKR